MLKSWILFIHFTIYSFYGRMVCAAFAPKRSSASEISPTVARALAASIAMDNIFCSVDLALLLMHPDGFSLVFCSYSFELEQVFLEIDGLLMINITYIHRFLFMTLVVYPTIVSIPLSRAWRTVQRPLFSFVGSPILWLASFLPWP